LRQRFSEDGSSDGVSKEAQCGALADSSLASLFRNSEINLGFTRMRGLESGRVGNNQVKLRDFEVPLAGGFYLVEEAPEHGELFDVGHEIVTWRSTDELIDKTRYYLAHESERRAIAAAGQLRARRDHTWRKRFSSLFCVLGARHQRNN
jgi:spore maturation protein CgeB